MKRKRKTGKGQRSLQIENEERKERLAGRHIRFWSPNKDDSSERARANEREREK